MPEKPYDHNQIELKWHERWRNADFYKAEENSSKPKFYVLEMLPYPSGLLRAPPTQAAPSLKRPMLRMLNAMWCPLPTSPNRFSTGTWQSARISGQVEDPRMPSLCSSEPIEKPGVLRSIRKAENFSPSTLAKTVNRSAKPLLVIHIFSPLRM